MSNPLDSHCVRCMTPAPPVESASYSDWEASTVDALYVICPDCITPEEQQQMDEQMMDLTDEYGEGDGGAARRE